jgi:hypothetical protein
MKKRSPASGLSLTLLQTRMATKSLISQTSLLFSFPVPDATNTDLFSILFSNVHCILHETDEPLAENERKTTSVTGTL